MSETRGRHRRLSSVCAIVATSTATCVTILAPGGAHVAAMGVAAANPEKGRLRQYRSTPFLMVPARQHFVIDDLVPQGIAVLTVQHQVRDIESPIAELILAFHAEVERLVILPWAPSGRADGSPVIPWRQSRCSLPASAAR